MTGSLRQVGHLLRFRWSCSPTRTRVLLLAALVPLVALLPVLCLLAAAGADALPPQARTQVRELVGAAHLLLVVGLLTSAVASSGGRELVPRAQLVAYPVAPAAEHLSALLLAPLNLAWWVQVAGLSVVTAAAVGLEPGYAEAGARPAVLAAALAVTGAWVAAVTALGQLLTWAVEIVRSLPGGRWWLRAALAAGAAATALTVDAGALVRVLDSRPAGWFSDRVLGPVSGDLPGSVATAGVLLLVALGLVLAGALVHRLLVRRPSRDQARQETHRHAPRLLPSCGPVTGVRAWRRADWASVRRSPPLRRGLVVLLLAPVAGGLLSRIASTDVVLLTAVVAAGAGLLFGVNAFCLDGEGAVWRASLPVPPRTWLVARGVVLVEVVLVTVVPATAAALLGATGPVTPAVATAVAVGTVAITGQVLARCLRWSVTSPHRAELRTTRDSPAPPGRMAVCSAMLVGPTALLGVALAVAARSGSPLWPVLVCLPSLALTAASLVRTARRWDDPVVRSAVVQAVSRG